MNVNQEAIDLAAEALMAQGELVGDQIGGLLDSVGLREPNENAHIRKSSRSHRFSNH